MARKTHRPDDIFWSVTTQDIESIQHATTDAITLGQLLDTKYPRKAMVKLFDEKLIHVNGHKATPHTEVAVDDEIWIAMAKEKIDHEPIAMDLHILYEDDDLLIVDKPAGVTVNSKDQVSLANGIAHYFMKHGIKRKVRFLNRLDRDTTGCIVIAKSGLAQSLYQQQMDDNTFEKWYMAVVEGIIDTDENSLVLPMAKSIDGVHYEVNPQGKETRTDFTVLHRYPMEAVDNFVHNSYDTVDRSIKSVDINMGGVDKQTRTVDNSVYNLENRPCTEVAVRLYTGKTHQIRVAFSHMGHPLVGDTLYGAKRTGKPFALRAMKVIFTHMRSGKRVTVEAKEML
ncbi:RluA family pseudouridine synthase [Veillonella sp.]|jgi:pseudouridine synthase, rluA family|uniref:RluA family pseudouridine synthase n=1 Tax=Veillonella sp. TaxID=1926307 RepID=UPI002587DEE3|nr:RluA family pseudouridine synthase [Veillonella sp.]MDU5083753.1 RluA family pseudouridine synthase [Veillonella sp.]